MASKHLFRDDGSREASIVRLFAKVTFGASGAPTLSRGKGITGITRSSAGKYVIALDAEYQQLLAASASFVLGSGVPAAPIFHVVTDGSASGSITVQFNDGDTPAATNPASGEAVLIEFVLSNATI